MKKHILCVSYELGLGSKREYGDLFAAFGVFEDRCHALESLWFLSTPWTAQKVYEYLRRFMDEEDSLMVEEMPALTGWSGWVDQRVQEWLTEHLGPPL
jgi:hypothetical protein